MDASHVDSGCSLVGVVSDTHGHILNTVKAVEMLASLGVGTTLHCGDIGSPAIPALFTQGPTHFVFGNTDYDSADLRQAIRAAGHTCHDRFGTLTIHERRIAWLHGDALDRLADAELSGDWDVVCYGHTHVREHHYIGKTLVLNPGALVRARRHSIAVVDLKDLQATSIDIV